MKHLQVMLRLLRRMPWQDSAWLLLVMLSARLTEGVGLLMIVPMIDSLYGADKTAGAGAGSGIADAMSRMLGLAGLTPGLGAMLLLFIALVAIRGLLIMVQQVLAIRYQSMLIDRLRGQMFEQLMRAEWKWLSARRQSDHVALLTVGSNRLAVGISQLVLLVAQLAALFAYVLAAMLLAWQVVLCVGLAAMILHFAMRRYRGSVVTLGQQLGDAQRKVQADLQDGLASVRLAKIMRAETLLTNRFSEAVGRLRASQLAFARSSGLGQLYMQTGGAVVLAGLLYFGKMAMGLPLSVLLAIVFIVARLIPAFATAQQCYNQWLHTVPALGDIETVLSQSATAAEPVIAVGEPRLPFTTAIRLDDVILRHPGRETPVLDQLSMQLPARTTTLLTGASGAGKSTLADLLMGLNSPDSGTISIDDTVISGPASGHSRQRWRASVAYVEQEAFLFHDTIRANLLFACPDATDEALHKALSRASADFVRSLPEGLDTVVGDRGSRLSGGERQRLALARALLSEPSLLILDEATSALDETNAAQVRETITQLAGQVTILIIAHRIDGWSGIDQRLHLADRKVAAV